MQHAKTTLLVMAAGLGSRFWGGIKQLEPIDGNGHIIMDYSVHDAIRAGFDKIVFIIRRDIEADFRRIIGCRVEKVCRDAGVEIGYAYQDLNAVPGAFVVPAGRMKPWGTGQAVLAARDQLQTPFAVINADDYYGKTAFTLLHDWLSRPHGEAEYALVGFTLKNTLSDNGGVTRGVCRVNKNGYLTDIRETYHIVKTPAGAESDGNPVDVNAPVSMNMWGLPLEFLPRLEAGFAAFLENSVPQDPLAAEYLLPVFIGGLLREKKASIRVLETPDTWFGVTYKEDQAAVTANFRRLIEAGVYRPDLYGDLG